MLIYKYRHPKAHRFLSENGFLPPNASSGDLAELNVFLSALISPSLDDQKYILIPILLEILSRFYKHQDAVFTLNEYISEVFPDLNENSHESLLG